MGERREGLRVETPASANRQATLPKPKSDSGRPNFLAGHEGWKDGYSTPREEEGEWKGLEETELRPEEAEGQGACGDESGPGPP